MKQFVRKMRALPLQSIKNCRQLFKQKMQIDISILSNLQNQINKYMKEFLSFVLSFFLSPNCVLLTGVQLLPCGSFHRIMYSYFVRILEESKAYIPDEAFYV